LARSFRGYEIQKKLGEGGMASIYLGLQKTLGRRVAIKILHPSLGIDESFISRFEREARAASSLEHRNIVTIHDFGSEDETYYIVMEYVDGVDMSVILKEHPVIPPEIVLVILEEITNGLETAHEKRIIHRDIKPGNVLLNKNGEVKVGDFGLARDVGGQGDQLLPNLTVPGSVLGTPAYMSPEQASGKETDHRTDIFSLGVLAYEMLTGEKPFQGNSYSEVREAVLTKDPPKIHSQWPLPVEPVDALIRRMLAKDPEKRFQSMKQVRRNLEECMDLLDPSGSFVRHRQRFLKEFAQDPANLMVKMRKISISHHLGQGTYFEKMGLDRIDDAIQAYQSVLVLDPENEKARSAVVRLRKKREESGIRPPAAAEGEGEAAPRAESAVPSAPAPPGRPGETLVLGDADSGVRPRGGDRRAGRKAVLGVVGAVAVFAIVAAIWRLWPGTDGGATGPAIQLTTDPAGALVSVRGPGQETYERVEGTTPVLLSDVESGTWEVLLEKDGYEPLSRSVAVGDGPESLSVRLSALVSQGAIQIATSPEGATIEYRTSGEGEFLRHPETSPATIPTLDAGSWEIRLSKSGYQTATRTLEVVGGRTAPWEVELTKTTGPEGRLRVVTAPVEGASVEIRRKGAGSRFQKLTRTTPLTTNPMPAGDWQVRIRKSGYQTWIGGFEIRDGETAALEVRLTAETPKEPGFVSLRIHPYGDVYLDGKLLAEGKTRIVQSIAGGKKHDLEVRHPVLLGSHLWKGIEASGGDTLDLGTYRFKWGKLIVTNSPPGPCDVILDGKKSDRQTPFNREIAVGTHNVRVARAGWDVERIEITNGNGGETSLISDVSRSGGQVPVTVVESGTVKVVFHLAKVD
jgi:serine/threonine-protein kinase